jgi:hypothetical protein
MQHVREEEKEGLLTSRAPTEGGYAWWSLLQVGLWIGTGIALLVLQGQCLSCVFSMAIVLGVLTTCSRKFFVPFLLCVCALVWHTYDYRRGSIRVEVPVESVLPSLSDLERYSSYVHLLKPTNSSNS